jgi:ABC-type molybdate transport system permease subunit
LSWLFLALFTVTGIFIALFLYWYNKSTFSVEQLVVYLLFAITPFVLGGFLWIASRALSEVIYLLMDIEDNSRHPKSPAA